jgi:tRNA(Ile)-lysidine synthase
MPQRQNRSKKVVIEFTEQVFAGLERVAAISGRMIAAVSGGPDSTALLVALNALRRKKHLDIAAVHANHALRGEESDRDERFVCELCARLHVELVRRRLPVPLDASGRADGIEVTARNLRLQFFADAASQLGASFVATAHTADDQVETVLHRIIRGTALTGLAGIPAVRELAPGIMLIRPLLALHRNQVMDYLAAMQQDSREDRSNRDLIFTRNRLRHELIPYLIQHFNPHIGEALTRLARHAADAQAAIETQVERLRRRAAAMPDTHTVILRLSVLRTAPPFLVRELVRRLWTEAGWPLKQLGYAELERITDIVTGKSHAWDLPCGVHARKRRDHLWLSRDPTCE